MARTDFRERLGVPWWAWPATLVGSVFLALELTMGAPALQVPPVYAAAIGLAAVFLVAIGRIRVAVRVSPADGRTELVVDDAHLPVAVICGVSVVEAEERRRLLGLDAEPLAFIVQRPWISGGVRVDLDDPDDPTPYWFVSSRRPQQLAEALMTARAAATAAG